MEEKKYTEAGTDINEVKRLNEASGLSYNDVIALLAKKSEVQKVDEIPFEPMKENLEVDSNAYKVNQVPGSINMNPNTPQ